MHKFIEVLENVDLGWEHILELVDPEDPESEVALDYFGEDGDELNGVKTLGSLIEEVLGKLQAESGVEVSSLSCETKTVNSGDIEVYIKVVDESFEGGDIEWNAMVGCDDYKELAEDLSCTLHQILERKEPKIMRVRIDQYIDVERVLGRKISPEELSLLQSKVNIYAEEKLIKPMLEEVLGSDHNGTFYRLKRSDIDCVLKDRFKVKIEGLSENEYNELVDQIAKSFQDKFCIEGWMGIVESEIQWWFDEQKYEA